MYKIIAMACSNNLTLQGGILHELILLEKLDTLSMLTCALHKYNGI